MNKENIENDNLRVWRRETYEGEWEEKSGKVRKKSDVKTEEKFRKGVGLCDRGCRERHTQWGENIRQ